MRVCWGGKDLEGEVRYCHRIELSASMGGVVGMVQVEIGDSRDQQQVR